MQHAQVQVAAKRPSGVEVAKRLAAGEVEGRSPGVEKSPLQEAVGATQVGRKWLEEMSRVAMNLRIFEDCRSLDRWDLQHIVVQHRSVKRR